MAQKWLWRKDFDLEEEEEDCTEGQEWRGNTRAATTSCSAKTVCGSGRK